jgi:hypothetical protein
VVLETFKEIKALIEGRARSENASDPSRTRGAGMNKGTHVTDGGFP